MSDDRRKVYIVTEGEYSDYCIRAVYSTRELAEERERECPCVRIEEYVLDHDVGHKRGSAFGVFIDRETGEFQDGGYYGGWWRDSQSCKVEHGCGEHGRLIHVQSPHSLDHAKKVAVEERQRWLRTQEDA